MQEQNVTSCIVKFDWLRMQKLDCYKSKTIYLVYFYEMDE